MNSSDTPELPPGDSPPEEPRKRCPQCKAWLPLSAFAKNATSPDGLQSTCRSCQRFYRAAWTAQNKEKLAMGQRGFHTKPLPEDQLAPLTDPASTGLKKKRGRPPLLVPPLMPPSLVEQTVSRNEGDDETPVRGRGRGRTKEARVQEPEGPSSLAELPVAMIVPSLTNPRKNFDQAALLELADSIRQQGKSV